MRQIDRDGILVLDGEGRLIFASLEAEALLGVQSADAAGRALAAVLGPGHPLAHLAARGGPAEAAEVTLEQAGRARAVRVSQYPLPGLSATLVRLEPTDTPASAPEPPPAAGALTNYAARLAALGDLTAGAVHEVRNPLNAMAIHVELLRRGLPAPAARQSLEVLEREIRRLDRLVQSLLDFLKSDRLRLGECPLAELLHDVRGLVHAEAQRAGVTVVALTAPDAPAALVADTELLRQALLHLARNAIHAMPHGGRLLLRAGRARDGAIEIRVEDQGVGIPADELEKVFRLHYTTKADAKGVGLAVVYRTVQLHGGRIHLDSRVGEGTRAVITLPASLALALEPVA